MKSSTFASAICLPLTLFLSNITNCLSLSTPTASLTKLPSGDVSRRRFNQWGILSSIVLTTATPAIASAASRSTLQPTAQEEVQLIKEASTTLTSLLENWDRATVDCTYADVPRELLESKNKEQLLEKASTFALFDKSTSVVSCKKTNKIVRDYIGVTGKGPMVGVEKRMLKRSVVELVDPDYLDDYFSEVESFSQALSRASSLSYAAGIADFDSVNNFAKDDKAASSSSDDNSNLDQARKAIKEAKTSMDKALGLFIFES